MWFVDYIPLLVCTIFALSALQLMKTITDRWDLRCGVRTEETKARSCHETGSRLIPRIPTLTTVVAYVRVLVRQVEGRATVCGTL